MDTKNMDLRGLITMSRKYGSDPEYVLEGGGNTSYKEDGLMAVKGSGSALSVIDEGGFVMMDVEKLRVLVHSVYIEDDKEREAYVLKEMMDARTPGQGDRRPSVECILHALFREAYVLHMHPALVNGLTCGQEGAEIAAELFGDIEESFLWIPLTKPGFSLSSACGDLFAKHEKTYGRFPSILLIQNHGVFVAADTAEGAERLMTKVVSRITERVKRRPETGTPNDAPAGAQEAAKKLEDIYPGAAVFLFNNEIERLTESKEAYAPMMKPFSPDHIIYCGGYPLFVDSQEDFQSAFSEYEKAYGFKPKVVAVRGLGVFALGSDPAAAGRTANLYLDAIKILVYSESFGGPLPLPDDFTDFILNWESESYRMKQA